MVIDVDNIDMPNVDNEPTFQDVHISHILTGSATMEYALENLRCFCPTNVHIAHPSTISEAHLFNTNINQILQNCDLDKSHLQTDQIIMFPTFHGDHTFGHWFLTILRTSPTCISGYIIDSLGHSNQRTEFIQEIFCTEASQSSGFIVNQSFELNWSAVPKLS